MSVFVHITMNLLSVFFLCNYADYKTEEILSLFYYYFYQHPPSMTLYQPDGIETQHSIPLRQPPANYLWDETTSSDNQRVVPL